MRARLISTILVCAALLGGALYYGKQIRNNEDWLGHVTVDRESRLVEKIFELANGQHLIVVDVARGGEPIIAPPPCDELGLGESQVGKERRAALELLCNSEQGEEIRDEIAAWNASFHVLAVRDNRMPGAGCAAEGERAGIYVPRGCKPNDWRVGIFVGNEAVAPTGWLTGAEPAPDIFSFLEDPSRPVIDAGDWAMLGAPDGADPSYKAESTIEMPAAGSVTIDLVGRLREIQIGHASQSLDPNHPPSHQLTLGRYTARVELLCQDPNHRNWNMDTPEPPPVCTAEPVDDSERTLAYRIDISGPSGPIPVTLNAKAVSSRTEYCPPEQAQASAESQHKGKKNKRTESPRIRACKVRKSTDDTEKSAADGAMSARGETRIADDKAQVRRTQHLRAVFDKDWRFSWERIEGESSVRPALGQATAADGEAARYLFDPVGEITDEAFANGLAPLVGLGPDDWGSLAHALSRHPSTVALTIDWRVQKAALDAVDQFAYSCLAWAGVVDPPDLLFDPRAKEPCAAPGKPDARARKRQSATLVVLDDDASPGAIRAVVTWPHTPKNLNMWDLEALETADTERAGIGWRMAGKGNLKPGSTFKAVTALSAIATVTDAGIAPPLQLRNNIKGLLDGTLRLDKQLAMLGVQKEPFMRMSCAGLAKGPSTKEFDSIPLFHPGTDKLFWCAHNDGFEPYFVPKSGKGRTECTFPGDGIGLCTAIEKSSNLYFGGLSRTLFNSHLQQFSSHSLLGWMAHRLSLGESVVMDGDEKKWNLPGHYFDLLRGSVEHGVPDLRAQPIRLDVDSEDDSSPPPAPQYQAELIRTGFGDQQYATPLDIALIYAGIARGRIVRPSLVPLRYDTNGCPLVRADAGECAPLLADMKDARPYLDLLTDGFRKVSGPGGTAHGRFDPLPQGLDKVYVKTGTATVSQTRFTLWTAGWVEAKPDSVAPRRLAFACMITNGGGRDFGGTQCGSLVALFLQNLYGRER